MNSLKWLLWCVLVQAAWSADNVTDADRGNGCDHEPSSPSHSRQKRFLWITNDGRLALPPGTSMTVEPSLSMPFIRSLPDGFESKMNLALPFTINFDDLGLTDNENPYGTLSSVLAKSKGRNMDSVLNKYVDQLMNARRSRRSVPTLPKPIHTYFHGGERALLYTVVEDLLEKFGMDGKACMLRTICEVNGHKSIHKFGFIGESLHLFLQASKSAYADFMKDYVDAETVGKRGKQCYPYFKDCPKSLFATKNSYSKTDFPSGNVAAGGTEDSPMSADETDAGADGINDPMKPDGTTNVTVTRVPLAM